MTYRAGNKTLDYTGGKNPPPDGSEVHRLSFSEGSGSVRVSPFAKEQIDDLLHRISGQREHLGAAVPTPSVLREMMRRQKGRENEGKIRRER
jgi:hypothetical protein